MKTAFGILALMGMSVGISAADTLELRDGRVLNGTFLSATSREVRFIVDGRRTQRFPVSSVSGLRFGDSSTSSSSTYNNSNNSNSTYNRNNTYSNNNNSGGYNNNSNNNNQTYSASRSRSARYTVPSGTVVTVRTIDAINSDSSNVGDTFRASLDEPLIVNGRTLAPQGADVQLRVVQVDKGSGITGKEEISLELASISVDGRQYAVRTSNAEVASKSRNESSVKVIGGTAILGAIIGGIAGGGKGAAIGAASGAGAGAAIQAIRGQRVQIPSESRLDFTLSEPVYVD